MSTHPSLEQALTFIHCQMQPPAGQFAATSKPAVTLSRMSGSGGRTVAARLAEYLQEKTQSECPWTVFDGNLVEKVLQEHHLPAGLAEYMPENHQPLVADTLEEMLGLHPSTWTLVQKTSQTIWQLAKMGNVILVGRGAHVITGSMERVFHVRLVGSVQKRAKRVAAVFHLSEAAALEQIHREDAGRRKYLREHFGKDLDDPLLYHLVVNTDRVSYEEAAIMIGQAVVQHLKLEESALKS